MWKGSISFGLVTIPVKLYAATESKDIRFNLLHRDCHTPVQYRKWCPECDREIGNEEIIKGYEFERGRFVTLEEEEFEAIPLAAKRALEIVGFVDLTEIDPVYFDKTYYLEPGEGGAKAYALLRRAMHESGRVALARVVIRTKESLAALRVVNDRVLAMETMHFPDEVRSTAGLTGIVEPELRPQEVKMATDLIQSLAMEFEPAQFENQYREAVLQLIQAKVQGEEVHQVAAAPEQGRVVDLMEALRASIRQREGEQAAAAPSADEAAAPAGPVVAPVPPTAAAPPPPGIPSVLGTPTAGRVPLPGAPGTARVPGAAGAPAGGPPLPLPPIPGTAPTARE